MKKSFYKQHTQNAARLPKASDAKYAILQDISRNYRQYSPSWEAALDTLLDEWLHGVPPRVDMRALHIALQSENINSIGSAIYRLCDECEVIYDER